MKNKTTRFLITSLIILLLVAFIEPITLFIPSLFG